MVVMKFGGTSVGEPGAIRRVSDIVKSRVPLRPAVVVSAVSKTTDELVGLAHAAGAGDVDREAELREWITTKHARILADLQFEGEEPARLLRDVAAELERVAGQILDLGKVTPELLDDCLSWGEYLSANILAAHLRKEGVPAIWIDSRDFMVTNARFGRARPVFEAARQRALNLILPVMESGQVPVIQGFVGRESGGRTTTFGRGGSDYSATVLGALIEAGCVEIWTDVDGIMTADPSPGSR
jgi:aspartate kinase